jgi:hypothetical protein
LRSRPSLPKGIPVTTRQLEALIRLAEARARVDLREVVTREDAEEAVELYMHSLAGMETDEFGVILQSGGGGPGGEGGGVGLGVGGVGGGGRKHRKGSKAAEAKRFLEVNHTLFVNSVYAVRL